MDHIAARRLWASVTVEPSTQSMKCVSGVLKSQKLRGFIRKVTYITVIDDLQGADCRAALEFNDRFSNLESIYICFSNSAHLDVSTIFGKSWLGHNLAGSDFQSAFLLVLLKRLYDPTYSIRPHLKTLSICNLTNVAHNVLTGSPHVRFCLSRISELRLKLWATIDGDIAPLPEIFTSLHRDWLGPTAGNLTSLTLYGNILWQYVPRSKFLIEAAYFSGLKRLELGSFPVTHEYQMDWILSHKTLEELVMNDCRITHYMSFPRVLDSEGHTASLTNTDNIPIFQNEPRWLQFFQQIEIRLPGLMAFRFACETAENFEDGDILERGLFPNRYMAFTRPWVDWAHRDVIKDPQCVWPQGNREMEIAEEKAYRNLVDVVRARRGKWLRSQNL